MTTETTPFIYIYASFCISVAFIDTTTHTRTRAQKCPTKVVLIENSRWSRILLISFTLSHTNYIQFPFVMWLLLLLLHSTLLSHLQNEINILQEFTVFLLPSFLFSSCTCVCMRANVCVFYHWMAGLFECYISFTDINRNVIWRIVNALYTYLHSGIHIQNETINQNDYTHVVPDKLIFIIVSIALIYSV